MFPCYWDGGTRPGQTRSDVRTTRPGCTPWDEGPLLVGRLYRTY